VDFRRSRVGVFGLGALETPVRTPYATMAASTPTLQEKTDLWAAFQSGFKRWALAAVAAIAAESVTFPIDVTKTRFAMRRHTCAPRDAVTLHHCRLQLQNELISSGAPRIGMVSTLITGIKTEGFGIFRGLGAAATRQAVYGGIGVGLYAPVRNWICGDDGSGTASKAAPVWYVDI
jgi:hypothetical protein